MTLQIDLKFRINISDDDILFWETNGTSPKLIIESARDVVQIFVNGNLTGIGHCVNSLLNVKRKCCSLMSKMRMDKGKCLFTWFAHYA